MRLESSVYFALLTLGLPNTAADRGGLSTTALVRANISSLGQAPIPIVSEHVALSPFSTPQISTPDAGLKRLHDRVNAKLIEGNVSEAVRVVTSHNTVLYPTEVVLAVLRLKHPELPADLRPISPPDIREIHPLCPEERSRFVEATRKVLAARQNKYQFVINHKRHISRCIVLVQYSNRI
ncbi:Hypothetical predicted protein [Octopus vulgaris]|uniref:Uncharacterized protein n=1 Tax=Octopus vulgaris TaxID=6645 RepID=A0AA36EXC2_OCTVU|nr:Hypothetical predicted protein [Octopus vulgaris]